MEGDHDNLRISMTAFTVSLASAAAIAWCIGTLRILHLIGGRFPCRCGWNRAGAAGCGSSGRRNMRVLPRANHTCASCIKLTAFARSASWREGQVFPVPVGHLQLTERQRGETNAQVDKKGGMSAHGVSTRFETTGWARLRPKA
jgi:hypothetical protein